MPSSVITVKQLNLYLKSLLEGDSRLAFLRVSGEISNFKNHFSSGHLYFTLKDRDAAVKCVMFRSHAARLRFVPADGMKVVCSGRLSVYERDGVYQLYAEELMPDGEGDLTLALEQIKQKLAKEGLFDPERKRPLPAFPKNIAVITSETGAAVRDIFNVLGRRYPLGNILFCPAQVQGAGAAESLCSALDTVISDHRADLIIIGRGGGSIEDLWCFNDERLARKIAASPIPVVSAVGHETDFTICDFAADLRAPTPSAAAELAVPDIEELKSNLRSLRRAMLIRLSGKQTLYAALLEKINASAGFKDPVTQFTTGRFLKVDAVTDKIKTLCEKKLASRENRFVQTAARLDALSPVKTLLRGYAVATKDGKTVASVKTIAPDDRIVLRLSDGKADCTVNQVEE